MKVWFVRLTVAWGYCIDPKTMKEEELWGMKVLSGINVKTGDFVSIQKDKIGSMILTEFDY